MIGIFDSGIGGLGTAHLIRKKAPSADLVYFGDLANMPYGSKSAEELFTLTLRAITFLRSQGATEFVAACNSVSVAVIVPMLDAFGTSTTRIIEMVAPAAEALREQVKGKVLVVATLATVRSFIYERAFARHGISVEMMALPELAGAIERRANKQDLWKMIAPAVERAIRINAKTLVFGCTQYPFVQDVFADVFAQKNYAIHLFDPSDAVAQQAIEMFDIQGSGLNTFFVSQSSDVFDQTVKKFFGDSVRVKLIDVDKSVDAQWKVSSSKTCPPVSG